MHVKPSIVHLKTVLIIACSLSFSLCYARKTTEASKELKNLFELYSKIPSDINEHLPVLYELATQCSSVTEIGIRSMVSTWGILEGLAESSFEDCSYLGIDIANPPQATLALAQRLAEAHGISFSFILENDMKINIPVTDLLFIDSLHTYAHLTYELENFSPQVQKYIALHDTSAPWGDVDDNEYHGNYSEYPEEINRNKRGLWSAVEDFLNRHPEWNLKERRLNNHGFTVLYRL